MPDVRSPSGTAASASMSGSAPSPIHLQSLPSSALPVRAPDGPGQPDSKAHHLPGNSGFVNPWPSFERNPDSKIGLAGAWDMLRGNPNAVPVPQDPKDRPVQLVQPKWDHGPAGIKMTWIGHASWLVGASASCREAHRSYCGSRDLTEENAMQNSRRQHQALAG